MAKGVKCGVLKLCALGRTRREILTVNGISGFHCDMCLSELRMGVGVKGKEEKKKRNRNRKFYVPANDRTHLGIGDGTWRSCPSHSSLSESLLFH